MSNLLIIFLLFIIIVCLYRPVQLGGWRLNGYEPVYNSNKWNKNGNNCYSYALNSLKKRENKPQPGSEEHDRYECPTIINAINKDLIDVKTQQKYQLVESNMKDKCPDNYHKIYLTLSDDDYHFYRLDSDGYWSHKPGSLPVTRLDAGQQVIKDPSKANHNYGSDYNYNRPCGFFCTPKIQTELN